MRLEMNEKEFGRGKVNLLAQFMGFLEWELFC